MAAEAQAQGWSGESRRREPRFPLQSVLDVTVLRSGIPDTVPGRSVNLCERGVGAMLAQELVPGEAVAIEVQLSLVTPSLRTRAIVRYQDKLCSGLEFVGMSADQRAAIRKWAKGVETKTETETETKLGASPNFAMAPKSVDAKGRNPKTLSRTGSHPRKRQFGLGWAIVVVFLAFAAAVFWWRWNRGWEELESGLKSPVTASVGKPQARVPAEVMEKLLIHRVQPTYTAEARKANLQGIVAFDIVVGRDGSVVDMRALNGPEVLARAAMDALRWWKFEPYRVNGEPAVVETTVAVEFKR
jgi:TonB family protein